MKLSRYIDNRVLSACIRPQLPKWCGPTTVAEIIKILLNKTICPHVVAKIMNWDRETIIKGFGTKSILNCIEKVSEGKIGNEIIKITTADKLWNDIQKYMKNGDVFYLHENGHHVLVLGYISEPEFTTESFQAGIDCTASVPGLSSSVHPVKHQYNLKRMILKAEHNHKPTVNTKFIMERELNDLTKELKDSERLHLVRLFLR